MHGEWEVMAEESWGSSLHGLGLISLVRGWAWGDVMGPYDLAIFPPQMPVKPGWLSLGHPDVSLGQVHLWKWQEIHRHGLCGVFYSIELGALWGMRAVRVSAGCRGYLLWAAGC